MIAKRHRSVPTRLQLACLKISTSVGFSTQSAHTLFVRFAVAQLRLKHHRNAASLWLTHFYPVS